VGFGELDIAVTACALTSDREKSPFALGAAATAATSGAAFVGLTVAAEEMTLAELPVFGVVVTDEAGVTVS
jgi:hypothetical protein